MAPVWFVLDPDGSALINTGARYVSAVRAGESRRWRVLDGERGNSPGAVRAMIPVVSP